MTKGRTVEVVPSLLAADRSRIGEQVALLRRAGARWVSVDVMDGHFVPNLSFGPDHVRTLKKDPGLVVDAHLMVSNPETAAAWFAKAGADFVTVHLEACPDPRAVLRAIRGMGVKSGLAVKPATPVEPLLGLLDEIDLALVMTVEPGFGGAAFLPDMLPKVEALRREIDRRGLDCWLQVDGGVGLETAPRAAAAGADNLVAGSAVFSSPDPGKAFQAISRAAREAFEARG